MTFGSRVVVLVLAVLGCLAVREYLLVTTLPAAMTDLALRQMQPSDEAAKDLRAADSAKSWLLSGWAVVLFAAAVAGCLFWEEIVRLARRPDTPPEQAVDEEGVRPFHEGGLS